MSDVDRIISAATPGPWVADEHGNIESRASDARPAIARVDDDRPYANPEADARYIATFSPEVITAYQRVAEAAREYQETRLRTGPDKEGETARMRAATELALALASLDAILAEKVGEQ